MTTFNIGSTPPTNQPTRQSTTAANPFASPTRGSGNLFYTPQTKTTQQIGNARPPPTQADRIALLNQIQKYVHHPDMEAGRKAHQAQKAEWAASHGPNAIVTDATPSHRAITLCRQLPFPGPAHCDEPVGFPGPRESGNATGQWPGQLCGRRRSQCWPT